MYVTQGDKMLNLYKKKGEQHVSDFSYFYFTY